MTRSFVLLLALAGCATVRQTYAPDGRPAFALNCSGTARGWDKCLSAAGQQCGPAGYDVLDRSDEPLNVGSAAFGQSGGSAFAVGTRERAMLVACKR